MGLLSKLLVAAPLGLALGEHSNEQKFDMFKAKFDKVYDSASEEMKRFEIFVENLITVAKMQIVDESASYSYMTPFADVSQAEFAKLNNLDVSPAALKTHKKAADKTEKLSTSDLPDDWDWRAKGAVTSVKNQGMCGSCWSFATAANIEGNNFVQNKELVSLSEQELVDCDTVDQACNGGLPSNAYKWMMDNKAGLELFKDYKYTGSKDKCSMQTALERVYLTSWVQVPTNEDQIAANLVKYGPLAIGINATPMQFYFGGISDPLDLICNPKALDHGVTLVGFGKSGLSREGHVPFWIIKNSWGGMWGEKGFYRIIKGRGKCGMNMMVTSAVVKAKATPESDQVYV